MRKIIHSSLSIRGFLRAYQGKKVSGLFWDDESGNFLNDTDARKYLRECLEKGWTKLPAAGCEGFDHFGGGCPGHPVIPNTVCLGARFRSKWFEGDCSVISIDESKNDLEVSIHFSSQSRKHSRVELWDLSHTKLGFETGDYFFIPETELE